jgi:uncharacterized protein YlxP (DUF503 family)
VVIGVAVWQLLIPGCASLKEKRSVIKGLKQRLHNEFNLSAAETAHHDVLQRSELAACVVAVDQPQANRVLSAADHLVEREARARIVESYTTYY